MTGDGTGTRLAPALHSLVVPIHNEAPVLRLLCERLRECLARPLEQRGERYEILLVDDGSTDPSQQIARALHEEDPEHVKLIVLSRNFGHQAAITAGIDLASGDTVTVLDADLQDPPEVILEMIEKWREGFDVVYGLRRRRQAETLFKRASAALFYRLLRASTRVDIPRDVGDFRLLSRRAASALRSMREHHRFVRGMACWIGFPQAAVPYVRASRAAGKTKFPLRKMLRFAVDALTGFSFLPLRLAAYLGLASAMISLAIACWALYVRLFTEDAVEGWTSLMIAVLFIGGVQLFCMGVLGEYVGRIFEEAKRRPLYVVERTLGTLGGEGEAHAPHVRRDEPIPEEGSSPVAPRG